MKNSLSFLGIVKKSGRLAIGDDAVTTAALTKKARLIILAADAGEYTVRRAENLSDSSGIPIITIDDTKNELGLSAGRNSVAMAAILDMGMAASYLTKLNAETGKYDELLSELTAKAERFARRKKLTDDRKSKTGKRRKIV